MPKKVFVSGCFDLLHSGHIAFLEEASKFGNVYAFIGSDKTIYDLKGRYPVINQSERKYILNATKYVYKCEISSGSGILDFEKEIINLKPDYFIVNEDGDSKLKKELCNKLQIQYKVLKRIPTTGLPERSTTQLRSKTVFPYRIDLCGGWLDQPFVSNLHPGPVLTISLEPTHEFNTRSGMATSSRNIALNLWNSQIPKGDPALNARVLFCYENYPGKEEISGSQDHLGLLMPGLNKLDYNNNYWPEKITSIHDEKTLKFIEEHIYLVPLSPRKSNYNVLATKKITIENARKLADSSILTWNSILNFDLKNFGKGILGSFNAQVALFPDMINSEVIKTIKSYKEYSLGHKVSGAGGGGYLIIISNKEVPNSIKIKIRRKNEF